MMIFVPEKQQQRHLPFFRENVVDTAATAAAFSRTTRKKIFGEGEPEMNEDKTSCSQM